MEALVRVRDELRDLVDIQVVALNYPATGPVAGPGAPERLRDAIAMGADIVGCGPHAEEDAHRALDIAVEAAVDAGLPLDVHADENLRQDSDDLERLLAVVEAGFAQRVTASHCTSLGIQPEHVQARVADRAAAAAVSIITNPIANLYLQGRGWRSGTPRGLTALPALLEAGVAVAAGGDNIQDPFIPVGKTDPLVTAQYMVIGGHLAPSEAHRLVGPAARALMGLPPIDLVPGSPADLVAVRARSLQEAVATATQDRLVFRRGVLVSSTRVAKEVATP
jgi:cytosine deaminase